MLSCWLRSLIAGVAGWLVVPAAQAQPTVEKQAGVEWQVGPIDTRPPNLDYQPGRAIPPGYRIQNRYHRAALTSGTVIFGISYTASVILAASRTEASSTAESFRQVPYQPRWLYLPVLGPWIAFATSFMSHDCRNSYYASSYFYGQCERATGDALDPWRAFLVVDGVSQGVGAALAIYGIGWRWQQLVLTEQVSLELLPVPMGGHGQGLALLGSFRGL